MKAGTFKAGQAKAATESFQIADHSGLTAYTRIEDGPQSIAIGQLVETHEEHWVNGYALGQQVDGREWRMANQSAVVSSGSTRFIETPLAKFGTHVAEIPSGDWIYQERDDDIIPDYRTLLLSCYARKLSATNGTLSLQWAVDAYTATVTSATTLTITDSSSVR